MKYLLVALLFCLAAASCKKPVTEPIAEMPPPMLYTDLKDAEVSLQKRRAAVDIDQDGSTDFWFGLELVGDPVLQRDRYQFSAGSAQKRNLLNDADDQSPFLYKSDTIAVHHAGYTWWEISNILLAEKIITNTNTYWDGRWKNASHNYLPVQVEQEGQLYQGWIELSFSTTGEKLILHRAALCKEAGKTIRAGY